MNNKIYPLFSVYGIEIEYMIVDEVTLNAKPIADKLIEDLAGEVTNEIELGDIAISNELALHIIELKTNGPTQDLASFSSNFITQIKKINAALKKYNAKLLSTGAHPWLNPHTEVKLWPHGDQIIYQTYNKIFDCRGHGWGNLQSTHLNLPFADDAEFKKLHSAIRLLLPVIPALAASTPIIEGKYSSVYDARLIYYAKNQLKIPEITGQVIPEYVENYDQYQQQILEPMYQAIAPFDQKNILQYEWLNSRGAIARFDRNTIEVRVIDSQEAPIADLAITSAIVGVLKYIIEETDAYLKNPLSVANLKLIYDAIIEAGSQTHITDENYLQQFGVNKFSNCTARELWKQLLEKAEKYIGRDQLQSLNYILQTGNLAERIKEKLGSEINHQKIQELYQEFSDNLPENKLFKL